MKRAFSIFLLSLFSAFAASPEVEITAEPSHHIAFENQEVRVFQVEVQPHTATLLHRHRHDYIFITLGETDISNEVAGKPPIELKLVDGETHFTAGNFAHVARNLSDHPFRNVTIELLEDEKMRSATSRWQETSGESAFPGGRIKVLFVKDGVRVTETDLDPGGTIPSHHHNGPQLVVAISDLDIRSDIEGQSPILEEFKSGDVKWRTGGYTNTLTNTGAREARFVAVEF